MGLGYKKHHRLDHGKNEFVKGKPHINGIEGFWGYAKQDYQNLKGWIKKHFYYIWKKQSLDIIIAIIISTNYY